MSGGPPRRHIFSDFRAQGADQWCVGLTVCPHAAPVATLRVTARIPPAIDIADLPVFGEADVIIPLAERVKEIQVFASEAGDIGQSEPPREVGGILRPM